MATVVGFICFCPDLRLYRYKITDHTQPEDSRETDLKFTNDELENSIAEHLANNRESDAEFLAHMTGLARVNAHKIVTFDVEADNITIADTAEFWKKHDAEVAAQLGIDSCR